MNMKKNARAEINSAKKKGVLVEEGNKEELQILYDMMVKRYSAQNKSANISLEYLFEIYDRFRKNIRILTAKYDDEIITSSIKIRFKNEELSWIGSPKPENFSPSPNPLITWEEIKDAYENGMDYYIQMGTAGNQKLRTYFSKFNPDLRIRFNVKKTTISTKILEAGYIIGIKPLFEKYHSKKTRLWHNKIKY
ncbi:MAG: GNAT family N-acetyltransferase [Methanogenium sp.]|nr:GNAT family N-acetyltransferase [Methanogenium sp.]